MDKSMEKGMNIYRIIDKGMRGPQNYRGQTPRPGYRGNLGNDNFDKEGSSARDRQLLGNSKRNYRSITRSRSGSRACFNGDRITCLKCSEYEHFAKDCSNITVTEKDQTEQLQQMLKSEEQETILKVIAGETYDSLTRANLEEMINHLN